MLVYLDESGDLGFDFRKKGTSSHFVMVALVVERKRAIEKVVSKTHAGSTKKGKTRSSVLHAAKEQPITNRRFCQVLARQRCKVHVTIIRKCDVPKIKRKGSHALYNQIAQNLIHSISTNPIEIIAAKRETNKHLNRQFIKAIAKKSSGIAIVVKTPSEDKCLQAADLVSWAVYRKYEYGDPIYYDMICQLIVNEICL